MEYRLVKRILVDLLSLLLRRSVRHNFVAAMNILQNQKRVVYGYQSTTRISANARNRPPTWKLDIENRFDCPGVSLYPYFCRGRIREQYVHH